VVEQGHAIGCGADQRSGYGEGACAVGFQPHDQRLRENRRDPMIRNE